ncbi:unnamed protein product [Macrosiphum euphorbiae]|uniref:Secreted protein n=1 Tax=Macrosiphum euphorbiae TaxID=13131 RepID=A0AAV0XCM2_9HEMI|nr:unnamed protein product [Macrosiphum euphorbiae]
MKKALKILLVSFFILVIEEIQSSSNDIAPMNTEQSSSSQSDSDSDQSIIYDDTSCDEELISYSDEED